jgi:hypothetical protein
MKNRTTQTMLLWAVTRKLTAVWCAALLAIGQAVALSQAQQPTNSAQTEVTKIPADQLETLVAPIALYPDPLVGPDPGSKRQAARGRCSQTTLGSERPGSGWAARCSQTAGGRHSVDDRSGNALETLEQFKKMDLFNPDKSWSPVLDDSEQ